MKVRAPLQGHFGILWVIPANHAQYKTHTSTLPWKNVVNAYKMKDGTKIAVDVNHSIIVKMIIILINKAKNV